MVSINTNLSSLLIQSNLAASTNALNTAIERMTTGFKINHAKDNAANYSISTKLSSKISAYQVAENNTLMGLDILRTASENLSLVTSHLERMRALTIQALNGSYGAGSLQTIQKEIDLRAEEISRVMKNTEYNEIQLYGDGSPVSTGDFIQVVKPLTEAEAVAQGYTVVKTVEELDDMRNNPTGKYILMNDIDLSGYNWEPMKFSGILDGNGYVIKNLKIYKPAENYVGFISSGTAIVRNLGLENVDITGKIFVGGLMGELTYAITNCYVTGKIAGEDNVGGLAGRTKVSTGVNKCYVAANVSGNNRVGGLLGSTAGGVSNSFSTGNVSGNTDVGGLVGRVSGGVNNTCYSSASVKGNSNTGGFAGSVTAGFKAEGYWNSETSGQLVGVGNPAGSTNITGVTTAELNEIIKTGVLPSIPPEELKGGSVFSLRVGIDSTEASVIKFDTTFSFELLLDVSTQSSANETLASIDKVLAQVNSRQTDFGAAQNRLESALEQISTAYDNLVSSRSTIRDANIAEESSEYIKMQILQQASATLLATANQTPAIALQLL